jgi:hypothetical protein
MMRWSVSLAQVFDNFSYMFCMVPVLYCIYYSLRCEPAMIPAIAHASLHLALSNVSRIPQITHTPTLLLCRGKYADLPLVSESVYMQVNKRMLWFRVAQCRCKPFGTLITMCPKA